VGLEISYLGVKRITVEKRTKDWVIQLVDIIY